MSDCDGSVATTDTNTRLAEDVLCDSCGWVVGMICPECSGCGCNNLTCSGWRHGEHLTDEDQDAMSDALNDCGECGGGSGPYGCEC